MLVPRGRRAVRKERVSDEDMDGASDRRELEAAVNRLFVFVCTVLPLMLAIAAAFVIG